jgi:ATP-binding cassette, subfamily B, bacterial
MLRKILRNSRQNLKVKINGLAAQVSYLPQTFRLVWNAARNWTILWIILLVIQGFLPAIAIYLTRLLVNSLVVVAGTGTFWQSIERIFMPITLMAGVLLLTQLVSNAIEWIRTAQAEFVKDYISNLVHAKSVSLDLAFYESSEFYDRLNLARSDADSRSLAILESSGSSLQNSITLMAIAGILIPYGAWLPVALFGGALPAFYIIMRLNRHHHKWWQKTIIERRLLQYYDFVLTSDWFVPELRLFNLGSHFQSAYKKLRHRLRTENLKLLQAQSLGRLGAGTFTIFVSFAIMAWILQRLIAGILTLGDIAVFYQAFSRGQIIISSLLSSLGQIYKNSLFIGNLFEFLQLEPSIINPPQPLPTPSKLIKGIQFEQIKFSYPGSERAVLTNFNLFVPAGKIVAIVGDNGAGKTTLLKLLCRLYDPDNGSVKLDNIDIRNISIDELRRLVTVLFQFPITYQFSAAQNIAVGNLSATPSVAEIEAAAKDAGAHEIIAKLPQGYDTRLGKWFPDGTDLSGGELQRLALARAFLRKAEIIILDEPTSAMDPWAEHDWLERFRTMAQGRTAIVITHRFTLAMRADIIHVMRAGQIVESGNHQELLALGGFYAKSWQDQMQSVSKE